MKRSVFIVTCLLAALVFGGPAEAQKKKKGKKDRPQDAVTAPVEAAASATAPTVAESSFEACQDGQDNDGDGHLDCDDQDCEIYAMCLEPEPAGPPPGAPPPPMSGGRANQWDRGKRHSPLGQLENPPPPVPVYHVPPPVVIGPLPERGRQCRDHVDNNGDGLIDCHEESCQGSWYCRREMYYVPEPEDKAPGLHISTGMGLALPNYRRPTAEAESTRFGTDVPFEPDAGAMLDLQVGYLPLTWLGFGVNLKAAATVATNRPDLYSDETDPYKYEGEKGWGHVGGFVRLQKPFGRFVPYVNLAGGYSYARYRWAIYDRRESWDNIDMHDDAELDGLRTTETVTSRHFTFAVEPGFDVFVRKRSIAIGMRAWLPVIASRDSSTDNIGVMLALSFTPMWREPKTLKPEYANPVVEAEPVEVVEEADDATLEGPPPALAGVVEPEPAIEPRSSFVEDPPAEEADAAESPDAAPADDPYGDE